MKNLILVVLGSVGTANIVIEALIEVTFSPVEGSWKFCGRRTTYSHRFEKFPERDDLFASSFAGFHSFFSMFSTRAFTRRFSINRDEIFL